MGSLPFAVTPLAFLGVSSYGSGSPLNATKEEPIYTLMDASDRPVTGQLENESDVAFQAFCVYRSMAPESRSLRSVAGKLGKNDSLIERWSARYRWMRRTAEWDSEQDRSAVDKQGVEAQEMRKRQVGMSNTAAALRFRVAFETAKQNTKLIAYLEKMPFPRLANLMFRANRSLIALHRAERKLVAHIDSVDLDRYVSPRSEESPSQGVTIVSACQCKEDHDLGFMQWPCESAKAYASFRIYRDLGKKRSIRATGLECMRFPSQMQRWASRFRWAYRANLYDQHLREEVENTDLKEQKAFLRRQFSELRAAENVIVTVLKVFKKRQLEFGKLGLLEQMRFALRSARAMPAILKNEMDIIALDGTKIKRTLHEIQITFPDKETPHPLLDEVLNKHVDRKVPTA
jgi:hypothetical protein